jgi:hypothetical protein
MKELRNAGRIVTATGNFLVILYFTEADLMASVSCVRDIRLQRQRNNEMLSRN